MRDQRRVFFERCIAVGIAVGVERTPDLVRRRLLARLCRRRRCRAGEFFCRLPGCAKFLPEQRARRDQASRVRLLQCLQLPLQLPQRKWHAHLRRHEKRLHEQHRPEKNYHSAPEQDQAQPWPALTARIGENKRRDGVWRDVLHEVAMIVQAAEEENPILWLSSYSRLCSRSCSCPHSYSCIV